MSSLSRTLKIFLGAVLLISSNVFASDGGSVDNGTDANGDLIVSPTLALRCGLSSQEPSITSDCVDRLAYDYKSGVVAGLEYANFSEMKKVILSEYATPYIENALKQLVASSEYEDEINKKMCVDSTSVSCSSASNDSRDEIEYNNKMAASNAAILLEALKLRAQDLNFNNIDVILDRVVPIKDVDLSDESLAGPP